MACLALTNPSERRYDDTGLNFSPVECTYQVRSGSATHAVHLSFEKVLRDLIPMGTVLHLRVTPALASQLPTRWADAQKVQVRLNVPPTETPVPGKVHVTYILRPSVARVDTTEVASVTVAADPWDLSLPDDEPVALFLYPARV